MDINMPVMDGLEASREIHKLYRSKNAERSTILAMPKIVALTASDTKEERARCLEAGMEIFLMKPPNPPDLKKILVSIFGERISMSESH